MIALELLPAVLRGMADNDRLGNVWNRDDCEAVAQAAEVLQTLLPSAPGAIEPDRPRSDEKNSAARQPLVGLSDEQIFKLEQACYLQYEASVLDDMDGLYPDRYKTITRHAFSPVHFARAIESALRAEPRGEQVVPARPTDDRLWDQTLTERDNYHEWADKLAEAIGKYFGVEIGDHTAGAGANNPWANALDWIAAAPSAEPTAWARSYAGALVSNELYLTREAAAVTHARLTAQYGNDPSRKVVPLYDHPAQLAEPPTAVHLEFETLEPEEGMDRIYAEYSKTFGRFPDAFMAQVVAQTKEDLFIWWTTHRERIRAGLEAAAPEVPQSPPTPEVGLPAKEWLDEAERLVGAFYDGFFKSDNSMKNALAALRAHLSARVAPPALQEGWQAVPKEPTVAMLDAAAAQRKDHINTPSMLVGESAARVWSAMLSAAPKQGETK